MLTITHLQGLESTFIKNIAKENVISLARSSVAYIHLYALVTTKVEESSRSGAKRCIFFASCTHYVSGSHTHKAAYTNNVHAPRIYIYILLFRSQRTRRQKRKQQGARCVDGCKFICMVTYAY
jgi:hypothetical protein